MHTIYRIGACVIFAGLCSFGLVQGDEPVDSSTTSTTSAGSAVLSGNIEATVVHDETAGTWRLQANGIFSGEGAAVTDMFLYGTDALGQIINRQSFGQGSSEPQLPSQSPFTLDLPLSKPDPNWIEIGLGMHLTDAKGSSTEITSAPFPIVWQQPVLIDHAFDGSLVVAPNYVPGGIPSGIGIPHALIHSVPDGDYYAVVFFDGLTGCPSNNFEINAFRANAYWGYDVRGPNAPYAKAFSSKGGGCMQEFHIDSEKDGDWLWGALSNTGTSSAIADASSVPAFAICATATACDPIIPHAGSLVPVSTTTAISSVLFLPGIKGSDLYEDNPLCLIPADSCGIKVWLPIADAAVPELFLDSMGKSKRSIFVRENNILESAFGTSFYDSFTRMLDEARANGTFGSNWNWKTVAYDWRLSLPDIVEGGVERGAHIYFDEPAALPYLTQTLYSLASTSPTKKVTIIAHSNGGLVAKALLESLGDTVAMQLIDTVVFVGVPQSGAPRTLGALLYGDAEGIPGIKGIPDFIMSAAHAREFGLNSPMAYHLLPSARYLSALQPEHPLVRFEDSNLLAKERTLYGSTVDTEKELRSFALAEDGGRVMPSTDDLTSANILNTGLLSYAKTEHAALDSWEPPTGIEVYELGGYDENTISGIDLYPSPRKDGSNSLSYRPMFTRDGDGTVPVISALMMNASERVHHVWLDLPGMRQSVNTYSHANLFEAPDVQATLSAILRRSPAFPSTAHAIDVPPPIPKRKQFGVFVHSPVSLTVTDQNGERTSVGSTGTEEDIPESTAGTLGEVKYVLVPADDRVYSIAIAGEGNGTFTLDLQELEGDDVTSSSTIADVPVTESTLATLTLSDSITSAPPLSVDENGDGSPDFSLPFIIGATTFSSESFPPDGKNSEDKMRIAAPVQMTVIATSTPLLSSSVTLSPVSSSMQKTSPEPQAIPATDSVSSQRTPLHALVRSHKSLLSRLQLFLQEIVRAVRSLLKMLGVRPGS